MNRQHPYFLMKFSILCLLVHPLIIDNWNIDEIRFKNGQNLLERSRKWYYDNSNFGKQEDPSREFLADKTFTNLQNIYFCLV